MIDGIQYNAHVESIAADSLRSDISFVCCLHLNAQNASLKSALEKEFIGKTIVSRIILGERAVPPGYGTRYPVNTLVYPGSDDTTYRVEWGLIRAEVGPQMQNRFERRSSFRIAALDLKDDRLELTLQCITGGSAKLKLMLGPGWQSKFDKTTIQVQLARFFVFDEQPQQPSQTSATAPASTTPLLGSDTVSTNQYRHDPAAPKIEGRISDDDLNAVMMGFNEETRRMLSTLSRDAALVSRDLLIYQKAYSGKSDNASRPQLEAIAGLQDRLGQSMQAQREDDVIEMNEVFKRCVYAVHGAARDEEGNIYNMGAGRMLGDFKEVFLSNTARDLLSLVQNDIQFERVQRVTIERAEQSVVSVEQTLDKRDLSGADQQYKQLASNPQIAQVPLVQQYLQRTAAFRQDLSTYLQATQMDRRRDIAVVQQLQNVQRETDLLKASESEPLTSTYLRNALEADAEALRQKLASLPGFQFDEASYKIPSAIAKTSPSNLSEKLNLVSRNIADIDRKLVAASELRNVAAQPAALKTIEDVFGAADADALKQKAGQIPGAERIRASLAAEQQSLQAAEEAQARLQCEDCVTIKVLNATMVNITTTDANGYDHVISEPMQRLIVAIGGFKKGDGISIAGQVFEGGDARGDLICLGQQGPGSGDVGNRSTPGITGQCPILMVGSMYKLRIGQLRAAMISDSLPFLAMDNPNGSASAWQVLELCHGSSCMEVSNLNSR